MYEKYLSERIAQLRNIKKISARDMSLSLGQNENYINHIENGKSMPLCKYFFISVNTLKSHPRNSLTKEPVTPH